MGGPPSARTGAGESRCSWVFLGYNELDDDETVHARPSKAVVHDDNNVTVIIVT